jgi:hypothetical protein
MKPQPRKRRASRPLPKLSAKATAAVALLLKEFGDPETAARVLKQAAGRRLGRPPGKKFNDKAILDAAEHALFRGTFRDIAAFARAVWRPEYRSVYGSSWEQLSARLRRWRNRRNRDRRMNPTSITVQELSPPHPLPWLSPRF